jgi:hypothetical protein
MYAKRSWMKKIDESVGNYMLNPKKYIEFVLGLWIAGE